jgi:acyl-coenzyme A synthetase/AMP-(fatty) acid ligase
VNWSVPGSASSDGDRAGACAWGLQIREGFGQTETTAQIGNPPGQPVRADEVF